MRVAALPLRMLRGRGLPLDFLLESIGFSPQADLDALARQIRSEGEPVAWRGPEGEHLRLAVAPGVDVRLDRDEGEPCPSLWPHFATERRLRVAVKSVVGVPDSPFDALLYGIANPPVPHLDGSLESEAEREDYPLATYLTDARKLPRSLSSDHVLAVSIAGFSLDITYVGPNTGVHDPYILEEPHGARLLPLGDDERPGGCMELSLRVQRVRHLENGVSGHPIEVLETDAPGRPLELFVSRWHLAAAGFEVPRPGWRIEGAFLFTGRVSGGLPPSRRHRSPV